MRCIPATLAPLGRKTCAAWAAGARPGAAGTLELMAAPNLPTVSLMQPTLMSKPFHREGWIYEEKYDGWRVVAYKDADRVRLVSRNGRDLTHRFRELAAAVGALPARTLILDGEIAVFDTALVSRFEWLLRRRPKDGTATPPMLIAFDCLYARRKDLRERPLRIRRHVLEGEVDGRRLILPARRLADDGLAAWAEVLVRGYEGLVAKNHESRYVPGRTGAWLKVKQPHYREGERGFYKL
jgi:bifunctional non-homologous end joining protein LigD